MQWKQSDINQIACIMCNSIVGTRWMFSLKFSSIILCCIILHLLFKIEFKLDKYICRKYRELQENGINKGNKALNETKLYQRDK